MAKVNEKEEEIKEIPRPIVPEVAYITAQELDDHEQQTKMYKLRSRCLRGIV